MTILSQQSPLSEDGYMRVYKGMLEWLNNTCSLLSKRRKAGIRVEEVRTQSDLDWTPLT